MAAAGSNYSSVHEHVPEQAFFIGDWRHAIEHGYGKVYENFEILSKALRDFQEVTGSPSNAVGHDLATCSGMMAKVRVRLEALSQLQPAYVPDCAAQVALAEKSKKQILQMLAESDAMKTRIHDRLQAARDSASTSSTSELLNV